MVVELFVEKLVQGGDGMASLDGKKVFVQYGAPQERIRARIIADKRDYAVARIEQILEPSPLRVEPPCPHYGDCGGCQLQHITYQGQLVVKKQSINESLQRIGHIFVPVQHATAESPQWHYRNKTQYPVGNKLTVGFFRRGTHELVDVPVCLLHPDEVDRLRESARAILLTAGETAYDEARHSGNVRHVIIRRAAHSGEMLMTVVTRTEELDARVPRLLAELPGVAGVVQSVNPAQTNRIMGSRNRVLAGTGHLHQVVLGKTFRVSAASFFQVNINQAEELCRKILKHVAPKGNETVLDLYCGVGMISLALAGFVKEVVGVEGDQVAFEDALDNARTQAAQNARFICGDVSRAIHDVAGADVVVLDPPRKGCPADTLRRVAELRPQRIVYVSCNPATLARDLANLEQLGYVTHEVEPVDMFPQTFHVEVIARLGLSGSSTQ